MVNPKHVGLHLQNSINNYETYKKKQGKPYRLVNKQEVETYLKGLNTKEKDTLKLACYILEIACDDLKRKLR